MVSICISISQCGSNNSCQSFEEVYLQFLGYHHLCIRIVQKLFHLENCLTILPVFVFQQAIPQCTIRSETDNVNKQCKFWMNLIIFPTVAKILADKFGSNYTTFRKFLRNRVKSSIYLEPPKVNEVINLTNSLNLNKSLGHDIISP